MSQTMQIYSITEHGEDEEGMALLTIDMSPDLHEVLAEQAKEKGLELEVYISNLLTAELKRKIADHQDDAGPDETAASIQTPPNTGA